MFQEEFKQEFKIATKSPTAAVLSIAEIYERMRSRVDDCYVPHIPTLNSLRRGAQQFVRDQLGHVPSTLDELTQVPEAYRTVGGNNSYV